MPDKASRLRALHKGPPILVLPNAWDAASARVFEAEGFPAIATTSAGVAAALGYPDGGVVPAREMIEAVARIARAVSVPVTADIEHAYAASPSGVAGGVVPVIGAGGVGISRAGRGPRAVEAAAVPRIFWRPPARRRFRISKRWVWRASASGRARCARRWRSSATSRAS